MRAGNLKHPVTIQRPVVVEDSMGSPTTTWETFSPMRAAIWPQKGKEIAVNNKIEMVVRHIIRMRYIPGILPEMRVLKNDGRIFEILSIKNHDEENRTVDLLCKENG